MIKAEIVAHSRNHFGHEIASFVVECPRFILAEFNTHRVFSRNSASSRAIPHEKMVNRILEDPFVPLAWQKDHKGMQGTEYITDPQVLEYITNQWLFASKVMVDVSSRIASNDVTKQLTNRLLEPFMWHRIIVTTTDLKNFFDLRCPKYHINDLVLKSQKEVIEKGGHSDLYFEDFDLIKWLNLNKGMAEIHMSLLAEAMYDAYNDSIPIELNAEGWHIPFGRNIDDGKISMECGSKDTRVDEPVDPNWHNKRRIEIATARCARVSYLNYEGTDDYEKDMILFDRLQQDQHMSPFEHCALAMSEKDLGRYMVIENGHVFAGRCRNFSGFIQLRAMIESPDTLYL